GVRSITDLMVMPGLINLDFADVRSVMGEMGKAMMGTGEGEGPSRALDAAERAIANPLLDGVSMQGAKGVIISIIGGEDMKLLEVDEAANHIRELVDPEANIIWGSAFNPSLEGKIRVSVVATGIEQNADQMQSAASQSPLGFGGARAPKMPVLPRPTEAELAEDAVSTGAAEYGQPARFDDEEDADSSYAAPPMPEPYSDAEEEDEGEEELGIAEPADDHAFGADQDDGYASLAGTRIGRDLEAAADEESDELDEEEDDSEALELTFEADAEETGAGEGSDELLLDSGSMAEAEDAAPTSRRRGILGAGADEEGDDAAGAPARRTAPAAAPTGGSTLFERMASLSRASSTNEEDEEEEESGGSSLRIPRFLGRSNNQ
ncbi:MAG: cell division protein FtsZ, partial [Croceibacterium sp.]